MLLTPVFVAQGLREGSRATEISELKEERHTLPLLGQLVSWNNGVQLRACLFRELFVELPKRPIEGPVGSFNQHRQVVPARPVDLKPANEMRLARTGFTLDHAHRMPALRRRERIEQPIFGGPGYVVGFRSGDHQAGDWCMRGA